MLSGKGAFATPYTKPMKMLAEKVTSLGSTAPHELQLASEKPHTLPHAEHFLIVFCNCPISSASPERSALNSSIVHAWSGPLCSGATSAPRQSAKASALAPTSTP
eukprot:3666082-Prymnesium_polylepis.1